MGIAGDLGMDEYRKRAVGEPTYSEGNEDGYLTKKWQEPNTFIPSKQFC